MQGLLAAIAASAAAQAQDTVYLASPTSSQGFMRLSGTVVDYSSAGLIIDSGGASRTFPAAQVARIETRKVAAQEEGDVLLAAGEFPAALASYRKAREQETRAWVRREITAQIVWCCRGLGQMTEAVGEFLLLARADPSTPHFDCIPLAWHGELQSAGLEQQARNWLRQESVPASVLLGASYLLPTEMGGTAISRLQNLSTSADKTIAQLALAQTWRPLIVSADPAQVAVWQRIVETMPPALRAGGYYVVGQGWARNGQWEKAALVWMRIPILQPQDRQLAPRALLDTAAALEKLQRPQEAASLYQELVQSYPESPWVSTAQSRLAQAADTQPPSGRNDF